mgnify:CR=1 FL=1
MFRSEVPPSQMKISVVTPSLNQGRFIERTIVSVLDQTGDFELEYIVADGGSTDQTVEILKQYQTRLIWFSEKDQGQSDALNKGFTLTTGGLLGWLNSDDTYEPGALDRVASLYKARKFEWCFGNCRIIDAHDRPIRNLITWYKGFEGRRYSYRRLLSKNFICQPSVFFTQNVHQEVGAVDNNRPYAMDYDYWLRIGKRYRPLYIPKHLANFRWHSGSKCGLNFTPGAREAYNVARAHAVPPCQYRYPLLRHYLHYLLLRVTYKMLS